MPPLTEAAREWNDTARFLAGMPGHPESPYRAFESSEAWREYAADFDRLWVSAQEKKLRPVEEFERRELRGRLKNTTVFYPFSGPDVLYARAFFPHGRTYIMGGLEPAGNLWDASHYTEGLETRVLGWRQTVNSLFRKTFFVTSEMQQMLRGQIFDGQLPVIALLLARSGHEIEEIRYVRLTGDGELIDDPAPPDMKVKRRAVSVRFRKAGEAVSRTLYYFGANLSESSKDREPLLRFFEKQGRGDALIKSASFLLHWREFEETRAFLLNHCDAILQDDTGPPYRYYWPEDWQVDLYGEYSHPDAPFHKHWQEDLAEEFSKPERAKPLGFVLGYGSFRRPSSMLLATRTEPGSPPRTVQAQRSVQAQRRIQRPAVQD